MRLSTRAWTICATIYRALVIAQTAAWVIESLVRISMRQTPASRGAPPAGVALPAASIIGIVAGIVSYCGCRSRWTARTAVLFAWPWFQVAGIVALIGYAVTGAMSHFLVGIVTLAVMHAFSPNRFESARQMP